MVVSGMQDQTERDPISSVDKAKHRVGESCVGEQGMEEAEEEEEQERQHKREQLKGMPKKKGEGRRAFSKERAPVATSM